jgi:hypothetical protein
VEGERHNVPPAERFERPRDRLIDVKLNHCAHGEWLPWLEAEFGWTDETARRFMNVAKMAKSHTVLDMEIPMGALYQLAAPSTPEPVRQIALEAITNGEKVTPGHIREMVRIAKPILEDQGDGDDDEHKAKMRYLISPNAEAAAHALRRTLGVWGVWGVILGPSSVFRRRLCPFGRRPPEDASCAGTIQTRSPHEPTIPVLSLCACAQRVLTQCGDA